MTSLIFILEWYRRSIVVRMPSGYNFLWMIAICILVLSVAALIEFAVSQWRSMWLTVASQPLSDCLETATGICAEAITANDFDRLLTSNQQLCPAEQQGNLWLKEVKIYYQHRARAG